MVDFIGSRPLFADNIVTFGSFAAFTLGAMQPSKSSGVTSGAISTSSAGVWMICGPSSQPTASRRSAWRCSSPPATPKSGKAFDRPGRATVVLGRQAAGEEWIAQHTHMSLFPGTPSRSFGTKREHPPAL